VAASFLRKLVGRGTPPTPEVAEALEELARLDTEKPALAGPARLLADILPVLFAEPIDVKAPVLTSDEAAAKVAEGVPLLRGESVLLDEKGFAYRWQHICAAIGKHQDPSGARQIADAFRSKSLDPRQLLDDVLAGHPEAIHAQADALGLDAGLIATVLRLSLFPLLTKYNVALAALRGGSAWDRGYCPTCGSWPLLGEFRGLEQIRYLRCGLCAADWEFPRLRCPFCNASDHHQLGYFYVEAEQGKYRVATCTACRGYVKMISTLGELSPPRLLVADVATMHLDLAAAERGFEAEVR